MKKFVILPDVTCDLSEELRKKFDIEYVKGHIVFPDQVEREGVLEWKYCTREEFYKDLKKNPNAYSTSPANIDEFKEAFVKYIKEGYDVLALTISSALSGTYNFALKAKELALEEYPDAKIVCIDSQRYSNGFGLIAIYASLLRSEGKSIDEVAKIIEEKKNCFHEMGWLDDLSFVAKKGRLSNSKAFFGTLIGIKPLGEFNHQGLTTVLGKAKGEKKAYQAIMNYIEKTIENPSEQIILIAQTNHMKQALEFKEMLENKFKPKEVIINDVFPSCGINVGPGLMAAFYMGKPISEDLKAETDIMNEVLQK